MNMEEQDKKEQPVSLEEEMRQLRAKLDNFSEKQESKTFINTLSLPVAIVIAAMQGVLRKKAVCAR